MSQKIQAKQPSHQVDKSTSKAQKDSNSQKDIGKGTVTNSDLAQLRALIDDRLGQFFMDSPATSRLGFAARHGLLSPGKRFRPIITILAAEQSGVHMGANIDDISPALLDVACAVEMVHAASLIMDDLPSMDNARLRRGSPTTHIVFGEAAATLATVALLNEAYKTISCVKEISTQARISAIEHLTNAIGIDGLAGGQDQDIACQGNIDKKDASDPQKHAANLKDMEKRHLDKTGALFAAAAAIGGEFAGLPTHKINHLLDYGSHLGLAYQAYDDVIDASSCSAQAGKDTAQDQDKSTVVSILGTDGARVLAERHLDRAIADAQAASIGVNVPLADLAHQIGHSFHRLTN